MISLVRTTSQKTGAERRTRSERTRTPASVMMRIQRSAREGVT